MLRLAGFTPLRYLVVGGRRFFTGIRFKAKDVIEDLLSILSCG
jgi:hypothetical protein